MSRRSRYKRSRLVPGARGLNRRTGILASQQGSQSDALEGEDNRVTGSELEVSKLTVEGTFQHNGAPGQTTLGFHGHEPAAQPNYGLANNGQFAYGFVPTLNMVLADTGNATINDNFGEIAHAVQQLLNTVESNGLANIA